MKTFRMALLAGTALSAFAIAPALAQTTLANPQSLAVKKSATYLSPLSVSGGGKSDPYARPASVSTISKDEINQFGSQNLDDALRATPGTFTRDNVQNPGIAVNIRGVEGSGRVNMMIDGVRQNFRFTGHEAQGFAYIDPAFISSVDISRGAVSGVGGAGALAGAANFRTLMIEDLIEDGKTYGGFVQASVGTNNAGLSTSAAAGVRLSETFAILGGLSKRNPGNYANGNGQTVAFTEQDIFSGIIKAEITPNQDHKLTLGGNFFNDKFYANSYFQTVQNATFAANYAFTPDNELIDLRANAYLNYTKMNYTGFAPGPFPLSGTGRTIEDKGHGFDVSNTSRFAVGDVDVEANYGFEYFFDDVGSINSATVPGRGVNPSGQASTSSLFSSTKLSYGIADLTLGLRYDHFTVDGSGSVTAGNGLGMPAGPYQVHRNEGRLNPKVTLALTPVDWFQPYITYAETQRAPTISESLMGGTHNAASPMSFFPNPFLKPEVSRGWELGANFNFEDIFADGDRLSVKADYFHNSIQDYVTAQFTPGGGFYFGNNAGTSTVQGIELQGAYDAGSVFAGLGYTYTNSKLPSQTNGAGAQSYLPDHVLTATLGLRLLEEQNLTVGTRLYAVSESFVGSQNVAAGVRPYEPGYGLVDLFTNYKFDNGLELGATVSNVFDTAYTPALSTPPGGSPIKTGRGRTFQITAKATF